MRNVSSLALRRGAKARTAGPTFIELARVPQSLTFVDGETFRASLSGAVPGSGRPGPRSLSSSPAHPTLNFFHWRGVLSTTLRRYAGRQSSCGHKSVGAKTG